MSQKEKVKSLLNSQISELDRVQQQSADRGVASRAGLAGLQSALQRSLRKETRFETKLRKILACAEELQEALAEARKHNASILEEHRTAREQLTKANKKIVYIEGLRSAIDHWFALLSIKFNELQELQARRAAATCQADSSSFDLTRHLRGEQSVNDSLRAQLSTLEHLKLKCLDEIASGTQQVRLLQHRLLEVESQLATRDTAQLDLKQENEEPLRQLTNMMTKFDQCQTKLSVLENSTVSAERYHTIMSAQQELSQQAMYAAKSQKLALNSMQQEILALSERNASLRHSSKNLIKLIKLHK
jgi:Asp-tRNA(Asn)/Glu-tRNA(Gln) amidotransferase C subunit